MTSPRSRYQQMKYNRYQKTIDKTVCVFCTIKTTDERFIEETSHFFVIKNEFPYSLWDHQGVIDHFMITPKVHIESLSKISAQEKIEYFDLVQKYELRGYNSYTRSPHSTMKTIPHQHTHLIKPTKGYKRFVFYVNKPYIRIAK